MGCTCISRNLSRARGASCLSKSILFLLCSFILLWFPTLGIAWEEASLSDQDFLQLAKEAHLAAKDNLRSGVGYGTLEIYREGNGPDQWELAVKARTEIKFEGRKYLIRLEYELNKASSADSSRIVYDGKTLIVNRFSKRIRPKGAEAEILPMSDDGDSRPNQARFPFDPSNLGGELFEPSRLLKKYADKIVFSSTEMGNHVGSVKLDQGELYKFEVSPAAGHHVTSWQVVLRNGHVHANVRGSWRRAGDIWYVYALSKDTFISDNERYREILRFDSFEPNVAVAADSFQLSALEVPEGARIVDQTPGAEVLVYRNTQQKDTNVSELDGLLQEIAALNAQPLSHPVSWQRIVLAAAGLALTALGIWLLWRRRLGGGGIRR